MEKFDREITNFYKAVEGISSLSDEEKERLFLKFQVKKNKVQKRKLIIATLVSLVLAAFLLSSVLPVFGHNGTLPQYIIGLNLENSTNNFVGALSFDKNTLDRIQSSSLSFSDAIVIVALSKENVPIEDVFKMREEGYGWGVILSNVGVSMHTVQNNLKELIKSTEMNLENEQETNQVKNNNQEQKVEKNTEQNSIIVVKGLIDNISDNIIVVAGKSIIITTKTLIKEKGNLIDLAKLLKGDNVLVHAKSSEGILAAEMVLLIENQDNAKESEGKKPEDPQGNGSENQNRNYVFNGVIEVKTTDSIKVSGTEIRLNEKTEITFKGSKINFNELSENDKVVVKANLENGTYIAYSITKVSGENENKEINSTQESDENPSQGQGNPPKGDSTANKESELRTYVLSFSGNVLFIKDFGMPVIVDDSTNIQKEGGGRVDTTYLTKDLLVQIHIRESEGVCLATSITILSNPNYKKDTFQGEIVIIDEDYRIIFLKDNSVVFKIENDLQGSLDLNDLGVGDNVALMGIVQPDGTVLVDKISIIQKGKKDKGKG
jgi:hypothetical protein